MSRKISENVERKMYAESMGRCMNPNCQITLFSDNGDIIEKAHIVPYCKTADNSFENLVVLCPNCHTKFDKLKEYTPEEVLNWKHVRRQELANFFGKKYNTFDDLKQAVAPLLSQNKTIYEKYYLAENRKLWEKFEFAILLNSKKLKTLFEKNLDLFQSHKEKQYSNLELVYSFLLHIDEFENTRPDEEKMRGVLFPTKINSMFGVEPISEDLLSMTESLEDLINKLITQKKFSKICLGIDEPFIEIIENRKPDKVFLKDIPRLRQLYFDFKCFKPPKVRFGSLNFALKYIRDRNIGFKFLNPNNLREIIVNGKKMIFIYEYCLSKVELANLSPQENSVIVNLHNWNGECCISSEAYKYSEEINVTLLTTNGFYGYINKIKFE